MIVDLIKSFVENKRSLDAIDLVFEYELYDLLTDEKTYQDKFSANNFIDILIDSERFADLTRLLEACPILTNTAIFKMSNNKLAKHAANLIERLNLDIHKYPLVLERLQKKTIRFYVYNYTKGPSSQNYFPLWKIEDLFSGYDTLLSYICEDLAFKNEVRFQREAKALALRNGIYDRLRPDTKTKLDMYELTEEEMSIGEFEDKFEPLSEPKDEYCIIPDTTKVMFIGTEEEVKHAEVLLESK